METNHSLGNYLQRLREAAVSGEFVKLTLSKPTTTSGDIKSIDVRPILVKRALKLSFTTHHTTRDVVKNYTLEEAVALIEQQLIEHFRASYLSTITGDVQFKITADGVLLSSHAARVTEAPDLSHDRAKVRAIASHDKAYLYALGIADSNGKVLSNAQDKFRQINRYIELLSPHLRELPEGRPLRIVDMGAGKGYLTFALYDYVANMLKRPAELVGVEMRAELVKQCNAIAAEAGFAGLKFVEGAINSYDCNGADVVIALHACDTATDDAIAKAIHAHAALIVMAPCCHKQIRRAMGKLAADHPLFPMLSHGTYVERMAEMLTDTLRAEFMAAHGYRTKLFEFISDAHTPKNVMIIGERLEKPHAAQQAAARKRIERLKAEFGIAFHALEEWL